MARVNTGKFAGFLAIFIVILGGAAVMKGGLYVARHEGDTLHFAEIILRMTAGEWPHFDFSTPIGSFAFAPVVALTKLGLGIGTAVLLAQVLIAIAVSPVVIWVARSRFTSPLAYLFGATIMVLCLSLVHGEAKTGISISMHYNRWAWAAAAIAICVAVIPPKSERGASVDGIIIGTMLAILAMIKMTYFVSFAIPVALGLLLNRGTKSLGVAAVVGLAVAVVITVIAGPTYWLAYLNDLLTVSGSSVRPNPGLPLSEILASPAYLPGTVLAVASVVLLRAAGRKTEGMLVLLLVPGFVFVTYQNFANDPQWLMILAILLLAVLPAKDVKSANGTSQAWVLGCIAAMAITATAPSYLNMAYSPLRHYTTPAAGYVAMLPAHEQHLDLYNHPVRAQRLDARFALSTEGFGLASFADQGKRPEPTVFQGETIADCDFELGIVGYNTYVSNELEAAGFVGSRVFTADLHSVLWLFGDFERLENGSPWYYGGLPGYDSADYLMVPNCALSQDMRKRILDAVSDRDNVLAEVHRTPMFTLYEIPKS